MAELKSKFNRYGASEWVTLVIGVIIFIVQGTKYTLNGLGDMSLEIGVAVIWVLLTTSPLTLANIIRKARGLEERGFKDKE